MEVIDCKTLCYGALYRYLFISHNFFVIWKILLLKVQLQRYKRERQIFCWFSRIFENNLLNNVKKHKKKYNISFKTFVTFVTMTEYLPSLLLIISNFHGHGYTVYP